MCSFFIFCSTTSKKVSQLYHEIKLSNCQLIKELEFGRFYFDFSMTYVGAGMICSHLVNLSLLLGAVVSWGIMWPLIGRLKGEWFPSSIPESSMKSLNGYKVFYLALARIN